MNVWKLNAVRSLTRTEEPIPQPEEGKYRIRVTKVLVNSVDAAIYRGEKKAKLPLAMGRFAIGIVSDENGGTFFPKGARVLLHTYLPAPDTGTAKKDFTEDEIRVCGITKNGYLRDFVYVSADEMTLLPDSISDEHALLVHHLALAKDTVDALGAQKGDHVAVIGGDHLGYLISQLLIYQQASPILVDSDQAKVDFAHKNGIYYSILADENVIQSIAEITGGRLANGAIYVTSADGNDTALPLVTCARGKHVVLCGNNADSLNINLGTAIKKLLEISCVHNGSDTLETAINLIVSGAVNLSGFHSHVFAAEEAAKVLEDIASKTDQDVGELHILSLI